MCNAYNHPPECCCGWGGDGHLGRRLFGNAFSPFVLKPISTNRSGEFFISYVNPNAYCPVCKERVYFYQSPHGGRVFFDKLGYPWPKHPCTDHRLKQTNINHIETGTSPEVIRLIRDWENEGYFPMVCIKVTSSNVIGQFLYEASEKPGRRLGLYAKGLLRLVKNELFFIKEIDSGMDLYGLRYCYTAVSSKDVDVKTNRFIRPILQKQRVIWGDFTSIKQTK